MIWFDMMCYIIITDWNMYGPRHSSATLLFPSKCCPCLLSIKWFICEVIVAIFLFILDQTWIVIASYNAFASSRSLTFGAISHACIICHSYPASSFSNNWKIKKNSHGRGDGEKLSMCRHSVDLRQVKAPYSLYFSAQKGPSCDKYNTGGKKRQRMNREIIRQW